MGWIILIAVAVAAWYWRDKLKEYWKDLVDDE